ncbi:MAG: FAD:protein FMN transferase [bacterium]|nr:FAD:protein FMN transferase [bacterium]
MFLITGCSPRAIRYEETKFLMGTEVNIIVVGKSRTIIRSAAQAGFKEISRIEDIMSAYKPDSELCSLNKAGEQEDSRELLYVINKARYTSELSNGAFDITCKPLIDLWHNAREINEFPDTQNILNTLSLVGYRNILIKNNNVKFNKTGIKIDLGGLAKGYAVDMAMDLIKNYDIKGALIDTGGDIRAIGKREDGKLWKIGIKHPRERNRIIGLIDLDTNAIATSGDYERFFMLNGKRYSHIIDPRTGCPVDNQIVSVSVLSSDCLTCDSLATAVTVLGEEKGIELIEKLKGVEALIITIKDGNLNLIKSSGMMQFVLR